VQKDTRGIIKEHNGQKAEHRQNTRQGLPGNIQLLGLLLSSSPGVTQLLLLLLHQPTGLIELHLKLLNIRLGVGQSLLGNLCLVVQLSVSGPCVVNCPAAANTEYG